VVTYLLSTIYSHALNNVLLTLTFAIDKAQHPTQQSAHLQTTQKKSYARTAYFFQQGCCQIWGTKSNNGVTPQRATKTSHGQAKNEAKRLCAIQAYAIDFGD